MKVIRDHMEKITIYDCEDRWIGNFALDNANGEIMIRSAWGNWCFRWTAMGKDVDLKHFLIDCNSDYIASKLAGPNEINYFFSDRTVSKMIKELGKAQERGFITSEQATELKEEIEELDLENIDSEELFFVRLVNSKLMSEFYDDLYDLPIDNGYHPRLESFMKKGWPLFIQAIKEETKEGQDESREVER